MAWTKDDIRALKKAIASGREEVSYGDRRVRYRSLKDMKDALAMMENEVNGVRLSGGKYVSTSAGIRS